VYLHFPRPCDRFAVSAGQTEQKKRKKPQRGVLRKSNYRLGARTDSPADGGSAPVSSQNSLAAPLWSPCDAACAASPQFSSRI